MYINPEKKPTQRIDRSEMTFNSPNFLFKHFVPESSFKLSLTERCRRNAHRFLTTTKQHLELERRLDDIIHRCGERWSVRT